MDSGREVLAVSTALARRLLCLRIPQTIRWLTPKDVSGLLAQSINQLRRVELGQKVANFVGYLSGGWCRGGNITESGLYAFLLRSPTDTGVC
jgi:hypothetical protein